MSADRRELPEPKSLAELAEEASDGGGLGIKCPRCHCIQFGDGKQVLNTRKIINGISRRRKCRACGFEWHTTEK